MSSCNAFRFELSQDTNLATSSQLGGSSSMIDGDQTRRVHEVLGGFANSLKHPVDDQRRSESSPLTIVSNDVKYLVDRLSKELQAFGSIVCSCDIL